MRRKLTVIVSTFIILSMSVVCIGWSGSAGGTIKIGAVLSVTGACSPLGRSAEQAIELLESRINKKGGIGGRKVDFIIHDDCSDPAKAAAAAKKLMSKRDVVAVIGPNATGCTLAISSSAQKYGAPLLSLAAGTRITKPVQKWVFGAPPTDAQNAKRMLKYIRDRLEVVRIAVIHDTNAFGQTGADFIVQEAPRYGMDVVWKESYDSTDPDMTEQLTKIRYSGAEALIVWGTNPGTAVIAKNMRQLSMTIPYVGCHGIASKKFIELAGDAANGVVFPGIRMLVPGSIPGGSKWEKAFRSFSKAYRNRYYRSPDTFAAYGWDAGNLVIAAIKKAGASRKGIRKAMEGTKGFQGISGVYSFNRNKHAGLNVDALIMIKVAGGRWKWEK